MAMSKTHIFSDMSEDTRKEWCGPCLLVADFFSSHLFCRRKKNAWLDIGENFSMNSSGKVPAASYVGKFHLCT